MCEEYTLTFGVDHITFTHDSYHFVHNELVRFEIDSSSKRLRMTYAYYSNALAIGKNAVDTLESETQSLQNSATRLRARRGRKSERAFYTQCVREDRRRATYDYPTDTVVTTWCVIYLLMHQPYSVSFHDGVITWSDDCGGVGSGICTTAATVTRHVGYGQYTNSRALLGDYYYFVEENVGLGYSYWRKGFAANDTLARAHVRNYAREADVAHAWVSQTDKLESAADTKLIHAEYMVALDRGLALFHLGNLYRSDEVQSMLYYQRAAELGNAYAQNAFAKLCCDKIVARKWLQLSADQGFPRAQYNLGLWYCVDEGLDSPTATQWLRRAARRGIGDADTKLAEIRDASTRNMVVVLQTRHDHNGVFKQKGFEGLDDTMLDAISDFHYVHIYMTDWKQIVTKLAEISGDGRRKIAHLIIMGHGTYNDIRLTDDDLVTRHSVDALASILRPHLVVGSSVFLDACSSGKGGPGAYNFAQALANHLPGHSIWGSEENTTHGSVQITRCIAKGGESIDMVYASDDSVVHLFTWLRRSTRVV